MEPHVPLERLGRHVGACAVRVDAPSPPVEHGHTSSGAVVYKPAGDENALSVIIYVSDGDHAWNYELVGAPDRDQYLCAAGDPDPLNGRLVVVGLPGGPDPGGVASGALRASRSQCG